LTSGIIGIYTLKPPPPQTEANYGYQRQSSSIFPPREVRDYYHAVLLPCDAFLETHRDPVRFAEILEAKGLDVCLQWAELNAGKIPEDRVMAERGYTLVRQTFRGERNCVEISEIEGQLSSYGLTSYAKTVAVLPTAGLENLKAS
jgi:hypothetical protein